jgi:hypothetical protein
MALASASTSLFDLGRNQAHTYELMEVKISIIASLEAETTPYNTDHNNPHI